MSTDRGDHSCESCDDCLHDGAKCCGCYDGACCRGASADSVWVDWLIKTVAYPFDVTFDDLPPVDIVRLALRWKELDGWGDVTDEEAIALVREEMGL